MPTSEVSNDPVNMMEAMRRHHLREMRQEPVERRAFMPPVFQDANCMHHLSPVFDGEVHVLVDPSAGARGTFTSASIVPCHGGRFCVASWSIEQEFGKIGTWVQRHEDDFHFVNHLDSEVVIDHLGSMGRVRINPRWHPTKVFVIDNLFRSYEWVRSTLVGTILEDAEVVPIRMVGAAMLRGVTKVQAERLFFSANWMASRAAREFNSCIETHHPDGRRTLRFNIEAEPGHPSADMARLLLTYLGAQE